ncbi:MAG TPA: TIGR04282 family arsenosugar biosynthesis glycosyltransferase [Candidatus Saccharimonadales bacterium]|nr:TIGR04282 family arsenosugar biosynthesis glycosyltransferase [Candidatus Saccharimonadales bacterium]
MPTRANALAVMAKAPIPGTVKTRLVPPLSNEQACELYRALLLDQLDNLTGLSEIDLYLAYTPADAAPLIENLAPPGFQYFPQRGVDLGARMSNVLAELWRRGHHRLVLIGSDLPVLRLEILRDAFKYLDAPDRRAVLGPSQDGGYYLVGMNQAIPEIFSGMTWSHDGVLADSLVKLHELCINFALLPDWFDVDTMADIRRLRGLDGSIGSAIMKRTLDCVRRLRAMPNLSRFL